MLKHFFENFCRPKFCDRNVPGVGFAKEICLVSFRTNLFQPKSLIY